MISILNLVIVLGKIKGRKYTLTDFSLKLFNPFTRKHNYIEIFYLFLIFTSLVFNKCKKKRKKRKYPSW